LNGASQVRPVAMEHRLADRILGKQACDHHRIKIGAHAHELVVFEIANSAIVVVETKAVFSSRFGMQFHNRHVILHEHVLDVQLGTAW
jgi:hypothetical protein